MDIDVIDDAGCAAQAMLSQITMNTGPFAAGEQQVSPQNSQICVYKIQPCPARIVGCSGACTIMGHTKKSAEVATLSVHEHTCNRAASWGQQQQEQLFK